MILFDTTMLVVLLQEKFPPVVDREGKAVSKPRERINYLIQTASANNSIVCVPTPALAEVLVRAGKAGPQYLEKLSNSAKFRLLPFDVKAAIEAAELIKKVKAEQRGQSVDTWAKIKFDVQIVSIAKAENASPIYSEDPGVENHADRVGIGVRRICDLMLSPQDDDYGQSNMFESEAGETQE